MNRLQIGVGLNHWGHSDLEAKKSIYLNTIRSLKTISLLDISNLGPQKMTIWKSEEMQKLLPSVAAWVSGQIVSKHLKCLYDI